MVRLAVDVTELSTVPRLKNRVVATLQGCAFTN